MIMISKAQTYNASFTLLCAKYLWCMALQCIDLKEPQAYLLIFVDQQTNKTCSRAGQ